MLLSRHTRRREFITLLGGVAAADAGAAAHDANGWRSGGAANRMRAWPCPMLMTRRKIIAQTMIGNETRPIKAKLRNASCLWETHQSNLWVLDFIRRSPPRTWNIVQHDCGNLNDQRRNNRPPRKCGLLLKNWVVLLPLQWTQSATRFLRWRIQHCDPSSDYPG
jgi:hypothetical protein